MGALRGCRAVKLDPCNNLPSSVHILYCNHSAVRQIEYYSENIIISQVQQTLLSPYLFYLFA